LTIHKSQGQTISKTVIKLGDKEQSLGLTFVALSRVKKFTDFLIEPFSLQRLQKLSQSKLLKPRLEEDKRLKLIFQKTLEYYFEIMHKTF
jgi:ATP-dependent exoDNAse (exonuclease V) alpha subunit